MFKKMPNASNLLYTMLVAVFLVGCETPSGKKQSKDGYSIIEIDSCEYIEVSGMVGSQSGYYSLSHKGYCKFCLARNAK